MGFPEEGLDLWQMYDCDRKMQVLTAYGLTDEFTPECGAWGQGAVESPMGWLAFMCWMSEYVDKMSPSPYTYNNKRKFNKVIYADDGTYFQSHIAGGQKSLNSVGTFATATGVGVKPTKSYVYTNCEGPPLTITTYEQNNTNYTLQNKKTSTLKQLLAGDYFRHLGNIQNAKGDTPIKSTKMYDESTQDNILTKVTNNMNAANSRNITGAGLVQVLNAVIKNQILYPTTYANTTAEQIEQMEKKIRKTLRCKLKIPNHINNDILYAHEDIGGIGENKLVDTINVNRILLIMQSIRWKGEMFDIVMGALEREKDYANINTNPLEHSYTDYVDEDSSSWIHQIKKWMEKNNITITIKDMKHTKKNRIMQHCHRKTNKNKIWKWINTNKVYTVEELVHTDLTWRQDLWKKEDNEIKTEMQSQLQPIIHKIASDKSTKIMYKKIGRWVTKQTRNISTMGKIVKINKNTATVKKYKKN